MSGNVALIIDEVLYNVVNAALIIYDVGCFRSSVLLNTECVPGISNIVLLTIDAVACLRCAVQRNIESVSDINRSVL